MDQKRKEEIIATYGKPFVSSASGGLKFNSICLCELFMISRLIRYIKPVKSFEEYDPVTKIWKKVDDDTIYNYLKNMILSIASTCIKNKYQVYIALTYSVLSNIVNLFRCQVGIDTLPTQPYPFVHLHNTLLVYDDSIKNFKSVTGTPEHNSRNRIERVYDPAAQCPRFLNQLVKPMLKNKGDLKLIQLYFGQCLLRQNISQTFLIISGPANIGKSVLVTVIEEILGKVNVTELHPERIANPFELAEYATKSLLTAKDVDNDALSANKINALKKMTGNDLLAAEQKNKNSRLYMRGNFNIIITGNGDLVLNFGNGRDAFKRRMIWIDCKKPENFERVSKFDEVLLSEEGNGILAWGIEGARQLLAAGGIISKGEEQEKVLEYLLGESSPIETFIKYCVTYAPDNAILSCDVVPAFKKFVGYIGWNNEKVRNMTKRQIEQNFCQKMLLLRPQCHQSTNIKIPGSCKMLRGYMHCKITLPEDRT